MRLAAGRPGPPAPDQARLRDQADDWRIPRLLDLAGWLNPEPAASTELAAFRRWRLEQRLAALRDLSDYLQARLAEPREDAARRVRLQGYLEQTRSAATRLQEYLDNPK